MNRAPDNSTDDPLGTPVQFIKGVGPNRAELLARLDLHTAGDLLRFVPREMLDLTVVHSVRELRGGTIQTVRGSVVDRDARELPRNRTLTAVLLDCGDGFVRGVWFNQPWMLRKFAHGDVVLFSAAPRFREGRWEMPHPRIQWLSEDDLDAGGGMLARYRLTDGLSMHEMRRIVRNAVEAYAGCVAELLPEAFRRKRKLPEIKTALRNLHLPSNRDEYDAARRRIVFDDLLEFQLGLALRRRAWGARAPGMPLSVSSKVDARIRRLFPFRFTAGQDQAVREIVADLSGARPMHRLLQADVGAGKTAVAVYAMLAAIAAGAQAALMAPTEVLAQQHWSTVDRLLAQSRVERRLLTGQLTSAKRRALLADIQSGRVQLLVGTQALIQRDVEFAKLGLVVIDEQHKFGVMQRGNFGAPEMTPHVLVMTATPIPRSLCLTQFGDLDVTTVADFPPGRQRVVTSRLPSSTAEERAWDFIQRQLHGGRQAYVVCPRVGESDTDDDAAGAVEIYRQLERGRLADFRVGLAHGRMDRAERGAVMDRFRHGELQVLVATTVIEVGVDVPNATLMFIHQAERFGLSQLHQLRGRIGRGKFQGYCFLQSGSQTDEAHKRLAALESTSDGFRIAETDFELRGPGDVLGTRQHGNLPLEVADLRRDQPILLEAREAAFELVESGELDQSAYSGLRQRVLARFRRLLQLPQSG